MSEKLDGVRAFWDGERLISRGGNAFSAPSWFTAGFPRVALDGELWTGRGRFEETASIVARSIPHDGWRQVRYMVFDLPAAPDVFDVRLQNLRAVVATSQNEFLAVVVQEKIADHKSLLNKLDEVTLAGGEGLMLHRGDSRYHGGRGMDLLKLKRFDDAEGIVIAHNPGKGKFTGMMGSVTVRTADGITVKIGSGFSDDERKTPRQSARRSPSNTRDSPARANPVSPSSGESVRTNLREENREEKEAQWAVRLFRIVQGQVVMIGEPESFETRIGNVEQSGPEDFGQSG